MNCTSFIVFFIVSTASSTTSNSSHSKKQAPLQVVSPAGFNYGEAFHGELHLHDQYTVGAWIKCCAPASSKPVDKSSYTTRCERKSLLSTRRVECLAFDFCDRRSRYYLSALLSVSVLMKWFNKGSLMF